MLQDGGPGHEEKGPANAIVHFQLVHIGVAKRGSDNIKGVCQPGAQESLPVVKLRGAKELAAVNPGYDQRMPGKGWVTGQQDCDRGIRSKGVAGLVISGHPVWPEFAKRSDEPIPHPFSGVWWVGTSNHLEEGCPC